jgi:ATP-dependent DNA helicase DinG
MVERRPDGEHRPQQELAVCAVEDSILLRHNALVQAGTGTGKSLAYLVPAVLSDDRISVSTATKQLSEQAMKDIEILKNEMREQTGKSFSSALLKGRDNYWCLKKADQLESMDKANPNGDSESLFKDEEVADITEPPESKGKMKKMQQDYKKMFAWADRTKTGDRSEAPAVDDDVWKGVSSTNTECPGKNSCPFGEQCFAEVARDKARKAKIVVTNHAIVGLDLENPESTAWQRDVSSLTNCTNLITIYLRLGELLSPLK